MKILVTGPLGHIGSKLIRHLPEEFPGAHITLVDNLLTQRYCTLFDLPKTGTYEFHEIDVATTDIDGLIERNDVVIHLAAMTDATGSLKHPELIAKNLDATKRVSKSCAKLKKPMLFASSTSVYGSQEEIVDETCSIDNLKPQSPYADFKIQEENHLKAAGTADGLTYMICRFGTICGVSPGMRFHTAVNKFCYQAVMGQPITVWRTAFEQKRPYLELSDACRGIAHIIRKKLFNSELYNLVTENTTVRAIVTDIQKIVPRLQIQYVDSAIMNQLSYNVIATKFEKTGFEFKGKLSHAIEQTVGLLRNANISIS